MRSRLWGVSAPDWSLRGVNSPCEMSAQFFHSIAIFSKSTRPNRDYPTVRSRRNARALRHLRDAINPNRQQGRWAKVSLFPLNRSQICQPIHFSISELLTLHFYRIYIKNLTENDILEISVLEKKSVRAVFAKKHWAAPGPRVNLAENHSNKRNYEIQS